MHRLDPGPVDLRDVRGVDQNEGGRRPEELARGQPGEARATGRRSREAGRAGSSGSRGRGRRRRSRRPGSERRAGPGSPRSTARISASGRITASAIRNIWTFSRNASAMPGKSDLKRSPLKNCRCTSGQPGLFAIAKPTAAKTIAELTSEMRTARRPSRGLSRPPRIFERPSSLRALLQGRDGDDLRQPGLLDLGQRPLGLHHLERLVHAADERVALLEGGSALRSCS